jgi:hypothetical protein
VDDLSLMQDLASLRARLGPMPEGEMKEPPGPLPGEVTGVALPAPAGSETQSLQQDLASLRALLGTAVPAEEMKEPPGPLPAAVTGTAALAEATSADIPLSPETGGRSIDERALEIGDIILSTTGALSSGAIRIATGSPVSHAALYVGGGQVVEAVEQGVVLRPLAEALADDTLAVALRHPALTELQALQVRDFAGQHLDSRYAVLAAIRAGLFRLDDRVHCRGREGAELERCRAWRGRVQLGTPTNDEFFCSHLVLAAFEAAGVPLTTTPASWNTPRDIVQLTLNTSLAYVGHLKTS